MLLNYLKLSIRLMARNPLFTFINVAGLAVGLAWGGCTERLMHQFTPR